MKNHRYSHRKKRTKPQYRPSLPAWLVLILAWIFTGILAFCLFHSDAKEESVNREKAVEAFSEQEPVPRPEPIRFSSSMQHLFPVNALRADKPTVLIYHTHTTEAYTQTDQETYRETNKWRTNDPTKNIVAVGETLKEILESDYGISVIHDTTDHEPPKLATAYERSIATMEKYHAEYPSIVLFIDLHRDAYQTDNAPCDFLTIDGTETARLMLVVGKGEKYAEKPYYDSNMAFAERITDHLNTIAPKLCRPVRVKSGRYNQHVAPNCILVEVGHNANTLSQAKASMRYLAESIAYAFYAEEIKSSDWVPN